MKQPKPAALRSKTGVSFEHGAVETRTEADDWVNNRSGSVASDLTSVLASSAAEGNPRRPPSTRKVFIR